MSNRPTHYKKTNKPKIKSTTFYIEKRLLNFLQEVASFENTSLSIIVERSLNYAKNKNFKRANKIKKKAKIYFKTKHKRTNKKAKQKNENITKSLFN